MTPDKAVEAAALALYEKPHIRGISIADMRRALEAAAPHLMAQAWDGGRDATIRAVMSGDDYPTNPYMLNTEGEQ